MYCSFIFPGFLPPVIPSRAIVPNLVPVPTQQRIPLPPFQYLRDYTTQRVPRPRYDMGQTYDFYRGLPRPRFRMSSTLQSPPPSVIRLSPPPSYPVTPFHLQPPRVWIRQQVEVTAASGLSVSWHTPQGQPLPSPPTSSPKELRVCVSPAIERDNIIYGPDYILPSSEEPVDLSPTSLTGNNNLRALTYMVQGIPQDAPGIQITNIQM